MILWERMWGLSSPRFFNILPQTSHGVGWSGLWIEWVYLASFDISRTMTTLTFASRRNCANAALEYVLWDNIWLRTLIRNDHTQSDLLGRQIRAWHEHAFGDCRVLWRIVCITVIDKFNYSIVIKHLLRQQLTSQYSETSSLLKIVSLAFFLESHRPLDELVPWILAMCRLR